MVMQRSKAAQAIAGASLVARTLPGVLALLVVLSAALLLTGTAQAASAATRSPQQALNSCSPTALANCYGQNSWFYQVGGASTTITPHGFMSCSNCSTSRFITNEMWVVDTSGAYWVEAGVATFSPNHPQNCNPGAYAVCTFWADKRPDGSYNEHKGQFLGGPGVDLTGYTIKVVIQNDSSNSATGSTWKVTVTIKLNGTPQYSQPLEGESTNNQMTVGEVTIGSELSTTAGRAGKIDFEENRYDTNGVWTYRTGDGQGTSTDPPPYGKWCVTPENSSTGGDYATSTLPITC